MTVLRATVEVAGVPHEVDWDHPVNLAPEVPVATTDDEATSTEAGLAFHLPAATQAPFSAGDFVGSTARGGPVNCRVVTMAPHGVGTHTESIGHIVNDPPPAAFAAPTKPVLALVATVVPVRASATNDSYGAPQADDDLVVTAQLVDAAASEAERIGADALVLRCGASEPRPHWSGAGAPYFTDDAMRRLARTSLNHLLVDLPSVDREDDGGALPSHRIWWGLAPGATSMPSVVSSAQRRSITEMIYVPGEVSDGAYLMVLQVPRWQTDAWPTAPTLYTLVRNVS